MASNNSKTDIGFERRKQLSFLNNELGAEGQSQDLLSPTNGNAGE
jgi:hypothetical protein